MDHQRLKEKASDAFLKGKFSRAAELYAEYCAADPKDRQARLRMGDAWAKAGNREKAIGAYRAAAEAFAKEGFLPRAIAASKLILELDPGHRDVQQMLADLYAQKSSIQRKPTGPIGPVPSANQPSTDVQAPSKAIDIWAGEEASVLSPPGAASNEKPPAVIVIAESEPSLLSPPAAASKDEPTLVFGRPRLEDETSLLSPPAAASNRAASIDPAVKGAASSAAEPPAESTGETLSDVLITMIEEPEAVLPPRAATVQKPNSSNRSADAFSFTELELEEGSLLNAVEAAATEGVGKQPMPQQNAPEASPAQSAEEQVAEPLPQIPLFSDLPPDAFVQLFERCPLRRYAMGEEIIAQGTIGHCFYVICAGSVAVFRLQDGKRTQITTLPEGSFFGEMALLSGSPRAASVESASEETQLLEISTSVLSELSQRYPTVARALRKFYRQRLLTNVMKTSRLFQPFNKADRSELVRRFRWRDARKGEFIVREGAETDGLYVILSGEVEVRKGHQTLLAKLKEGDLFGEMSLLTKTPATATVIATRRTSLLCLPRSDFDSLILGHPQVLMLVSELTDERQGQAQAMLSQSSQQSLMI